MKHAHELRNLLNAALFCVEADNEKKMHEIWDALKLAEQINTLANVQFFDDWQTLEKAEFVLQRANEVLSEYRDLADIINRNPTAKGLFYSSSQWRELELHLMEEHAELIMYMVSKNMQTTLPAQAATREPATEPEDMMQVTPWLKEVFITEEIANMFLKRVQHNLTKWPKQESKAVIDAFIQCNPQNYKYDYKPTELADQLTQCTGICVKRQNIGCYKGRLQGLPKKQNQF